MAFNLSCFGVHTIEDMGEVMGTLRIINGRIIDPSQSIDRVGELWLEGAKALALGPQPNRTADRTIDAAGKIVCPGLIDMHVHLREPGQEEDETIATGTAAALAGGFATIACMADTDPPIDTQAAVEFVQAAAQRAGNANLIAVAAVTRGRGGQELAEMGGLAESGAAAFSDDEGPITSAEIMRRALEYSRMVDRPILSHCEDSDLTREGLMNEGCSSMMLGLRGIPAAAEEVMLYRDLTLAEQSGGRLHVLHVSTARSVELIRTAKKRGVRVTTAVCPHHLSLTDECLQTYNSNFKVLPPLRTLTDVDALIEGLRDGTIDVIASDHSPQANEKKQREFGLTPFGIIGLETLLPICITSLIESGRLTWPQLIEKLTVEPARILGARKGSLQPGADADVTIIDPAVRWQIDSSRFRSKCRNTPFEGRAVLGKAQTVIVGGAVKFEAGSEIKQNSR